MTCPGLAGLRRAAALESGRGVIPLRAGLLRGLSTFDVNVEVIKLRTAE